MNGNRRIIAGVWLLVGAAFLSAAPSEAMGQTLFQDKFDTTDNLTTQWTLSPNPNSTTDAAWGIDAAPSTVAGGLSFNSAPNSLNYNNGINYSTDNNTGGAYAGPLSGGAVTTGPGNSGTALSPQISLSSLTGTSVDITITFQCNYETESGTGQENQFDARFLAVLDQTGSALGVAQYLPAGGSGTTYSSTTEVCGTAGTWHSHTVTLTGVDPSTITSIRLQFAFDTVDDVDNTHAGWFVDDVEVAGPGGSTGGGGSSGGGTYTGPLYMPHGDTPHERPRDKKNGWCGGAICGAAVDRRGLLFALVGFLLFAVTVVRRLRRGIL